MKSIYPISEQNCENLIQCSIKICYIIYPTNLRPSSSIRNFDQNDKWTSEDTHTHFTIRIHIVRPRFVWILSHTTEIQVGFDNRAYQHLTCIPSKYFDAFR